MAKLTTVTFQTDGLRDYVCLPDGIRYILGTVSVLRIVSSLVAGQRMKRRALDEFNESGQATVKLDIEQMFEMLGPRPLKKSAHGSSLIQPQKQAHPTSKEGTHMSHPVKILDTRIAHLENTIRELDARTASGGRVPAALVRNLHQAAISLTDFGDQSKNDAFYGLGEPVVDTMEDPGAWTPPAEVTHPQGKTASHRTASVLRMAEQTLKQIAETSDQIDTLAEQGEPVDTVKAQSDLHEMTSEIHDMLSEEDMDAKEAEQQLAKVARRVQQMHRLFDR